MSLDQLSQLVEDGQKEEGEAAARKLLADGVDPLEILDKLTQTMQRVGDLFAALDIFLPEVMLAGEALTAVVDIVKPELKTTDRVLAKGRVVIGVVKGDLHEIGKNIVKLTLMTTTMPRQQEIIEFLKDKGLRDKYKVVIGGAPTSQMWADKIGADLYCEDANCASQKMAAMIA